MDVMRASPEGKATTRRNEGYKTEAYRDNAAKRNWTIGVGHAETNPRPVRGLLNGEFYQGPPKEGVSITQAEVERLFREDSAEVEEGLSRIFDGVHMSQGVFDALFDMGIQFGVTKLEREAPHLHDALRFNPASDKVIDNLVLWMRSGGVPQESEYRRRLRNVCQCKNVPIPDLLWDKKQFPWCLDSRNEIDFSVTMPWDMVVAIAKNPDTAPRQTAPVSVEIASPSAEQGETKQNTLPMDPEPLPHEAEASPALPLQPVGQGVPAAPASAFGGDAPAKPYAVDPLPPLPATKKLSPNTLPVPPGATSKPIEESKAVDGHVIEKQAEFFIRIASLGGLGTCAEGIAKFAMRDPAVFTLIVTGAGFVGVWGVSHVWRAYGMWKKARGRAEQVQVYR